MINMPLVFIATSDIAGITRGKAVPVADLEKRLVRGVGWTPTNVQITCFDVIADSPYGALGDLLLVPDETTGVDIDFEDDSLPERFMMGNITTLEGEPWECCTRTILRSALDRLKAAGGVSLLSAFEHEFQIRSQVPVKGGAYSLAGFSEHRKLGETLMAALDKAGMKPDSFMKEYGPGQYEVVVGPHEDIRSADAAVMLRELTRMTARHCDAQATFSPIRDPDSVGNGVHIHMSFLGPDGLPVTCDENGIAGMSELTGSFIAGILKYLDSIVALTAPSAISYLRLTPHRWSAAYNNLGFRDREASVRICPVTATDPLKRGKQYNFEFRAADAAASPYLALAAIIHAGSQGIEENLPAPPVTEEDLSVLSARQLEDRGYTRLPSTLNEALGRFEKNKTVRGWFPKGFDEVYLAHKRGELAFLADMDDAGRCSEYEKVY